MVTLPEVDIRERQCLWERMDEVSTYKIWCYASAVTKSSAGLSVTTRSPAATQG